MELSGIGLHGGKPATVELVAEPGPLRIERNGVVRPLAAFRASSGVFATCIACDAFELRTVEHLFAALAGLGIRDGLRIVASAAEVPLLDGSARAFASHARALGIQSKPPELRVARAGRVEIEGSTYELEPGDDVRVEVEVELPACCASFAAWDGRAESFVEEIAPARTFVLERDLADVERLGLGKHAERESVLVVGERAIFGAGEIREDEPARHKLLDLIGDAFLHGGPPRGTLRARRPGHARNHAAFARALELGILATGDAA